MDCIHQIDTKKLPLRENQNVDQFMIEIAPVIFDPGVMSKRSVQSGDGDLIKASSNNYYGGGISQKEVEDFYAQMKMGKIRSRRSLTG